MMKKYESFRTYPYNREHSEKSKSCWLVSVQKSDIFAASLININMPNDEIMYWVIERYTGLSGFNKIYMFCTKIDNVWTWSPSSYGTDSEFKGEVTPTKDDMEKWEIMQNVEKYNL